MLIVSTTFSRSYVTSDTSLRGGSDSILVSVEDLRIASEKMITLKYELKKSELKDSIIYKDSIKISNYAELNNNYINQNKKLVKQRNVLGCVSIGLLSMIIGLLW